ncbi:hypothetical protein M9194_18630 [Vibrio sp. S4M6]|uniref:hypothetical protein n=1 Tax=Vibrio sinus TaxID=2946865 RepID=UPI00202A58C2|nr:hypothetical protein [Vibrio sinus]MCL9783446.1 hypothetical protein [Vibrio sinus]
MKTSLKIKWLLAVSAIALAGCQALNPASIKTTASTQTIETAKKELTGIKHLKILDNGVIYYNETVAGEDYRWNTASIMKFSYDAACVQLRQFVKEGMVVRMQFAGIGGTVLDYDEQTCQSQAPTNK